LWGPRRRGRRRCFTDNACQIDTYGFDYDYTLATYNENLEAFIYEKARDYLVDGLGYPELLRSKAYDPKFAIRGEHRPRSSPSCALFKRASEWRGGGRGALFLKTRCVCGAGLHYDTQTGFLMKLDQFMKIQSGPRRARTMCASELHPRAALSPAHQAPSFAAAHPSR
jgi:hypothetical protein